MKSLKLLVSHYSHSCCCCCCIIVTTIPVPDPVIEQSCTAAIPDPQTGHYTASLLWSLSDADCVARIQQFRVSLTGPVNTSSTSLLSPVQV